MNTIRYTLLPDGSSDEVLLNHLTWLLRRHSALGIQSQFAHMKRFQNHPKELDQKVAFALDIFPCDLLFIHRDAEKMPYAHRRDEIQRALITVRIGLPPAVCVIPIHMQEAWLLFDEKAIRTAAGRPSGRQALNMPPMKQAESVANPKDVLHSALRTASELAGRRLDRFSLSDASRRVGEIIDDFSPLLALSAFAQLDEDIRDLIEQQGWS